MAIKHAVQLKDSQLAKNFIMNCFQLGEGKSSSLVNSEISDSDIIVDSIIMLAKTDINKAWEAMNNRNQEKLFGIKQKEMPKKEQTSNKFDKAKILTTQLESYIKQKSTENEPVNNGPGDSKAASKEQVNNEQPAPLVHKNHKPKK